MTDSLIRKEDAIKALGEEPMVWTDSDFELADRNRWQMDVEALKKLQPIQPKHGKWLPDNRCGGGYWVCSSCKHPTEAFAADVPYKYCPFCGADMRTKETDCDYERAVEQLEHDMLYEPTFDPDDGSM